MVVDKLTQLCHLAPCEDAHNAEAPAVLFKDNCFSFMAGAAKGSLRVPSAAFVIIPSRRSWPSSESLRDKPQELAEYYCSDEAFVRKLGIMTKAADITLRQYILPYI